MTRDRLFMVVQTIGVPLGALGLSDLFAILLWWE